VKLVLISDTHQRHRRLSVPYGDVLIHAGDFTNRGEEAEVIEFDHWLMEQPHKHKLVIPGNHDRMFQSAPLAAIRLITAATLLNENGVVIEGKKFWGSPWTPFFRDWAFNYHAPDGPSRWAKIPDQLDVLITHGPPLGILDFIPDGRVYAGCPELRKRVIEVKPKLHVFGHIHESGGSIVTNPTVFVNASMAGHNMKMDRKPIIFHL
jgi:Icc-related predicted phosphoesterase